MDNGASSYRRFLGGDESGLVEIIRDYKDGLILYLHGIVGNLHTAEELAEDTFVRLATKRPKDQGKSSFKTWLYAIGRHIAIDYLRRSKKHTDVALDAFQELSDEEDLERAYIREEQKITLHRAMGQLKSDYRQILWLIYFEELSHKEAALVMNKSVHNIETLVYRARQALKRELNKEGFWNEDVYGNGQ